MRETDPTRIHITHVNVYVALYKVRQGKGTKLVTERGTVTLSDRRVQA